jgi:hypothetical protein
LIENDSLRLLLNNYYDNRVGYQFSLQNSTQRNFEAAKERQFELFTSFRFWDKMKPIDYHQLMENKYYKSWLSFTHGEREWETGQFQILNGLIDDLLSLIKDEIDKAN